MNRWMSVLLILIAALALAACGDDEEDDADTPQVEAPVEQNAELPGGDDAPRGPVTFTIAGAPEGEVVVQASQFALQRFENAYFLTMESRDEDPSVITLENIPLEPEATTYTIGSAEGDVTARVEIGPESDVAVYDQDIEGTLTIEAVAEGAISGTFRFTASPANAPEIAQTISVSGAFNDLALP